ITSVLKEQLAERKPGDPQKRTWAQCVVSALLHLAAKGNVRAGLILERTEERFGKRFSWKAKKSRSGGRLMRREKQSMTIARNPRNWPQKVRTRRGVPVWN